MNDSKGTSMTDILALVCAIVMVVGFLFMPWISFFSASATGWNLLTVVNAVNTGSGTGNTTANSDTAWGQFWLLLILAAGVCGALMALWGLANPSRRRVASKVSLLAGLAALAPMCVGLFEVTKSPINVAGMIGIGVWATMLGAIGLVVQAFLPRPVVEDRWAPSAYPSTYASTTGLGGFSFGSSSPAQAPLPPFSSRLAKSSFQPLQDDTRPGGARTLLDSLKED